MRRTTRSQTRAASAAQDTELKDPLNKLSHDELGVVFDLLARSSLWPFIAVALTSTCKGIRKPLLAQLEVLERRYTQKRELCQYLYMTCAEMRVAEYLVWGGVCHQYESRRKFRWAMEVLGTLLVEDGMPMLTWLDVSKTGGEGRGYFNGESAENIARGLHPGSTITHLLLDHNAIGDVGATALAASIRASRSLKMVSLHACEIGPEGARALAAALTARITAKQEPVYLEIGMNPIGDEATTLLREASPPKLVSFASHYVTARQRFMNTFAPPPPPANWRTRADVLI